MPVSNPNGVNLHISASLCELINETRFKPQRGKFTLCAGYVHQFPADGFKPQRGKFTHLRVMITPRLSEVSNPNGVNLHTKKL